MMRRLIVLAVACALPGALIAQDATPAGGAPAPVAKPVKEKKICHSVEVTGSYMPKSVCHTKEDWEQIEAANARQVQQMGNQRSHNGN